MAVLYYDVRIDMSKNAALDTGYRFTQGDSGEEKLRIAVMNGSVKYESADAIPSLNFCKPDGTVVIGTPEKQDDVWIYTFLGTELQAAGKVLCDMKFDYGSSVVSSAKFTFFVEKNTISDGAIKSSSYISKLEEVLKDANEVLEKIEIDEQTAQSYLNAGKNYAEQAESYAHGNTGKRTGEDTDNSKYYAEQAAQTYDDFVELSEDMTSLMIPACYVDTSDMHLKFTADSGWSFEVDKTSVKTGHLIWTVNKKEV